MRRMTIQWRESSIERMNQQFDNRTIQKSIITIDFLRWTRSESSAMIEVKFALAM